MAIPNKDDQDEKPFPGSADPERAFIQDLRTLMLEAAEAADREKHDQGRANLLKKRSETRRP